MPTPVEETERKASVCGETAEHWCGSGVLTIKEQPFQFMKT
jgi:hypothetical protein